MTLKRTLLAGLCALLISAPALAADLDPVRLTEHVKVLSDDAFGGRAPDTEGERKTVAYLVDQFRSLGLKPGGDLQTDGTRAWTQDVPLARFDTEGPVAVSVNVADQARTWTQGEEIAIRAAQTGINRLTLKDVPL
ncbi:MAG: peptidase M20, partial [Phenylobacterium sp.]